MNKSDILNIINKVYPKIAKDYNSNATVELHNNEFDKLKVNLKKFLS